MRIEIEIPEEFEKDYTTDKFAEFLGRVRADIDYNGMCGNYERETADVLAEAFKNSRVVQPVAYEGGRLIDAYAYRDDFMQDVYEVLSNESDNINANLIIDAFDRIPTAYDVDKVVAQLESESARWQDSGDAYNDEKEKGVAIGFRKAIEIVKGGGVDGN